MARTTSLWISRNERNRIYLRDNFICQICFQPILHKRQRSIDHIVPRSEGGDNSDQNLRTAHRSCNLDEELKRVKRLQAMSQKSDIANLL
jgi:5-methylcytosine-specific restriction endonuclease McrA